MAEREWQPWNLWPTAREIREEERLDDALSELFNSRYAPPEPVPTGRMRGWNWSLTRERIFERDNHTCVYCGAAGGRLECDHVFPVSRGGSNDDENLATACFDCNRSKRDKTLEEWSVVA